MQPTLAQQQRFDSLYHLSVELTRLRSLDKVMDTALEHCLALTNSQFGFIGLNTDNMTALDVVAIRGFHPQANFYHHNHVIPLRPNVFARVVLENRSIRSGDVATDPARVGLPSGHPGVGTFMGVPLRLRDQPIGMIGLANRDTPYELEHEQLLAAYASQVSIAIRNAQLYEQLQESNTELEQKVQRRTQELEVAKEALAQKATQLQELYEDTISAQEEDRRRISQEIHDGVNQLLTGAILELTAARKRLQNDDTPQAETAIDASQGILRQVDSELRNIINGLHPPTLHSLGLVPALRSHLDQVNHYAKQECHIAVQGQPIRLPEKVEINLFRLVQEAVQNALNHSQAQTVRVAVDFETPNHICVSVVDDGIGFDVTKTLAQPERQFGLLGMQERVTAIGGTLQLESDAAGTRIVVEVPRLRASNHLSTGASLQSTADSGNGNDL